MFILPCNYGNESIGLIQWSANASLKNVYCVSIDTGWAAPEWNERVQKAEAWVHSLGFIPIRLKPKRDFAALMQEQKKFPTRQFQWCASFLKGLPLLEWLDFDLDPERRAQIVLAHRRASSRAKFNLAEWIEDSEHYNGRSVWHPLYLASHAEMKTLIKQAGFPLLAHRSLECDPCVNSNLADVLRMDLSVIERAAHLEQTLNSRLLDPDLYRGEIDLLHLRQKHPDNQPIQNTSLEMFDMGCGSPYGCGL